MTNQNLTSVTVIGLGLMGRSLAAAFLRAGHPTTVWNRTPSKAGAVPAEGANHVSSAGDAVAASPLTVVCVSDYQAMYGVLDRAHLEGRVVVNLCSGTSAQAREAAQWAESRGARYLDGAIMAIPQAIGTDEAVILLSGRRPDFEAFEPVLKALGAGTTYVGADHGLASLYDATGLGLMWNVLNAFLHGAALLETAGVKATAYAPFAKQLAATVAGWLPGYAEQLDQGSYPALDSTLLTHLAAMRHLVEESESLGVNAELPRLVKEFADRAVARGRGEDGYVTLIDEFRTG